MRRRRATCANSTRAMTLTELVCVVAIIVILVAMILPTGHGDRRHYMRIKCINNLKNVGLAYRIFATDHNELFPFQLSTKDEGSLELRHDVYAQFRTLSNELSTPKILLCPRLHPATETTNWFSLDASNVGYYVGLTASQTNTNSILSGDTGFTVNGAKAMAGINQIRASEVLTYPKKLHGDSDLANLVHADGSVLPFRDRDWPRLLRTTGSPTNEFVMP